MLHPSRCCAEGRHLVETELAPGIFRCVWCNHTRMQPSTGVNPLPAVGTVRDATGATAHPVGGCCGDSLTRQANYPRPTITERKDDLATEIDERFRTMARELVRTRPGLAAWCAGNPSKVPEAYRP